jgi:hypothetical protein
MRIVRPAGLALLPTDPSASSEQGGTPDAGRAVPEKGTPDCGGAAAPSVLIDGRDSTGIDERVRPASTWTRQQKRIFHRVKSLLLYWECANYAVLWVVLTTARGGNNKILAYHHKKLRNSIERKLGYQKLEFLHVQTAEGNGVLHVLWAWKIPKGKNKGVFYIDQQWLSEQWLDIHGASYVFINRYGRGRMSSHRVSRYLVSQYVSNQDALVRVSWSRLRSLGFPLARTWNKFKSIWKSNHSRKVSHKEFIKAWERLIDVRSCWLGEQQYAIWDNDLNEL